MKWFSRRKAAAVSSRPLFHIGGRVSIYIRILCALALATSTVGPVSAATVTSGATTLIAQATSASVTGRIMDSQTGGPVVNATVLLKGPSTYTTTTDASGNFQINNVTPGIYSVSIRKAGYNSLNQDTLAVLAGSAPVISGVMQPITFTTLRTIASVRSTGRGTFNATPASLNVISSQAIEDQGQVQIMKVLNETPGIVASLPQTSANGATPGAITFPNIRGALSFETASLIDGHPISVGTFGDYVTTFLNPFMLQNVEVVKGPGADAPEVNYALGGTVNFRTKDPTFRPSGVLQFGADTRGSAILNFGISDTIGRLGYVAAFSSNDLESAVSGARVFISPQSPQQGIFNYNGSTGTAAGFNDVFPIPIVPGTVSAVENSYNLVACCQTVNSLFQNRSELVKLRYRMSNATNVTFTYFGAQTMANQAANTGDITPSTFAMSPSQAAGYSGALPNGSNLDIGFVRTPETEYNNEPIFEGEIHTTINQDTLLARYYAAGITGSSSKAPRLPRRP